MKKEKVFIVLSHKHVLKKGSKTEWEVAETVEFVSQLRNRHLTSSVAIADYINRKMQTGARSGMGDYAKFEEYIGKKYPKELAQLDKAYKDQQVQEEVKPDQEVFSDEFGNIRARTVFDQV